MSTQKLQSPFMTRIGQFEEEKHTLAVGILESVVLKSPANNKHFLEMGNWIYGQTFAKLREARERYKKHIWVNARGKRVCIFPVMDVFEAIKQNPAKVVQKAEGKKEAEVVAPVENQAKLF